MFLKKYRFIILLSFFAAITTISFARNLKEWDKYNTDSLQILYPDTETKANPPLFHWHKLKEADHYKITLKGAQKLFSFESKYNFFIPETELSAGKYRVLVIAIDKYGKTLKMSEEKRFTIIGENTKLNLKLNNLSFEKDKPLYPLDKLLSDIKAAKNNEQAIYRDNLIEYVKKPANDLIKNLKEPDSYNDNKWNLEQWTKINNTAFSIRDYVLPNAIAYKLTNDKQFLNNAKNIMLEVAKWNPYGSTGIYDDDHAAQSILYSFSMSFSLIKNDLSETDKKQIIKCIKDRTEDMYGFLNPFMIKTVAVGAMNDPTNNHPWFCTQALGAGAMALMGECSEAPEWLSFASQLFYGLFLPIGGVDGDWHEGIDYWSYTLFFVFEFCDALKNTTGINFYEHPWLKNTAFFKIYTHPPVGTYVPFGDCKHNPANAFDKLIMMRLASEFNDPLAWKYVDSINKEIKGGYLPDALMWSERDPQKIKQISEIPFAFNFRDTGWVVCNSDLFTTDSQFLFAFRCGKVFGNAAHSHPDQNHFILTAGGDKLIWDWGYYDSYGSQHHYGEAGISAAHNLILIDGEGQAVRTPQTNGKLLKYEVKNDSLLVEGDASNPKIYNGKVNKFIRTIKYENKRGLYLKDDIILNKAGQISWLLNSAFPIKYNETDKSITITGKSYKIEAKFISIIDVEPVYYNDFKYAPIRKKEGDYPSQYRLELKTKKKITNWKPEMILTISKLQK